MSRDPRPGPDVDSRPTGGLARGLVWSDLLAEMRAEARAAGDDRFDRLDRLDGPAATDASRRHLHVVDHDGRAPVLPATPVAGHGRRAA